jgi:hypothetical protein
MIGDSYVLKYIHSPRPHAHGRTLPDFSTESLPSIEAATALDFFFGTPRFTFRDRHRVQDHHRRCSLKEGHGTCVEIRTT